MSDVIPGLRKYLLSCTDVARHVLGRIYPEYLPTKPNIMPSIVLREIDSESEQYLCGGAGLAHTRVQVDCYADTSLTAKAVRESVRLLIKPSATYQWDTVTVTDLQHETFLMRLEPPSDGSENWRHVASFDLLLSVSEDEPT